MSTQAHTTPIPKTLGLWFVDALWVWAWSCDFEHGRLWAQAPQMPENIIKHSIVHLHNGIHLKPNANKILFHKCPSVKIFAPKHTQMGNGQLLKLPTISILLNNHPKVSAPSTEGTVAPQLTSSLGNCHLTISLLKWMFSCAHHCTTVQTCC